ncbi:glycosyltransferase [Shewanella colwelliana]|uniref:glycosyltransferase n=1 Tax=Shewanella colwelliana TaxID=23 RepID=UPI00373594BA
MKKLLVNGFSAKAGGGKVIFENFLKHTNCKKNIEVHVVCPPGIFLNDNRFIQVPIPNWQYKSLGLLWFYFFYLPSYCKKIKVDSILNFGDIILPRIKDQTYFFDWAYLVLKDNTLWKKMSLKDRLVRRLKSRIIFTFRNNNSSVIVQSEAMGDEYKSKMLFTGNLIVARTPVAINGINSFSLCKLDVTKKDFVYISNYAPHKNFEIIPLVAKELKENNVDCRILITLPHTSKSWEVIRLDSEKLGVSDKVYNLGPLTQNEVFSVLNAAKGLFFPSLLESYGMPLIEGLLVGVPVLTSDIPFIKSVCGESVVYFDPNDEKDIYIKIKQLIDGDSAVITDKQRCDVLGQIPTWENYSKLLLAACFDEREFKC